MYKKQHQPRIINQRSQKVARERSPTTHLRMPGALEFTAIQTQTLTFLSQQTFVVHQLERFRESHNPHRATLGWLV
jgi:hypothetical protein